MCIFVMLRESNECKPIPSALYTNFVAHNITVNEPLRMTEESYSDYRLDLLLDRIQQEARSKNNMNKWKSFQYQSGSNYDSLSLGPVAGTVSPWI